MLTRELEHYEEAFIEKSATYTFTCPKNSSFGPCIGVVFVEQ